MKKALLILGLIVLTLFFIWLYRRQIDITTPLVDTPLQKSRTLDKYTIEALSQTKLEASKITLGDLVKNEDDFSSRVFSFNDSKAKVSGLINIPRETGTYPVIVMFRGYIEKEEYSTGMGTQRAAEVFAQNGFITLSPDFLGYGSSDNPSANPIEERFQTYTTALTLLESISNLNESLESAGITARADPQKVAIWGHSNGGQIALTILEITGRAYPTVLWAPVSKPFPYSVLYFTDDFDDHGKKLRRVIADFEKDYDVELYSLTNYFEKINASIQINQGQADEAVPSKWSDQLVEALQNLGHDVEYFTYAADDHNFSRGSWLTVVNRNIVFFTKHLNL